MTCLIVEDQSPAQRILRKYIADIGTLDLRGTYADALGAAEHLRTGEAIDLLFLDVNLPKLSGIEFLRSLSRPPAVILTTAYPDYALQGYELNVTDYLLKPFGFPRFVQAVAKVGNARQGTEAPAASLFLKDGHQYVRLAVAELMYLEAGSDYTTLVTPGKKHLSPEPLRDWLERLRHTGDFVRIHRSFVVNVRRVLRLVGNEVFLEQGPGLPVGRTYKAELLRRLRINPSPP